MSKEADRLLAEVIGYTDITEMDGNLLGWAPNTPKPLPPKSERDIHFVGKYRVFIPAFAFDDSETLKFLMALPEHIDWDIRRIRHSPATGIVFRVVINVGRKDEMGASCESLHEALEDAVVKEYDCCPKCGSSLIGKPPGCSEHGFCINNAKKLRLKPAFAKLTKEQLCDSGT